jgi:glucokinase
VTLTVGVDVGGTSVRAGVVDGDGTVLDTARTPTPPSESALEAAVAGVVRTLADRHRVAAVGLALAGFITPDRRVVRFAPHLSWRDAPVADRIGDRIGLPVVVEHDANAAALAERYFGAAAGAATAVFVALGTGIGSALLLDGLLYRGAFGVAPELGHLQVVPDGRPCPCGKTGCWERYCSGTALATTAVELMARDPGRSPLLSRLAAGDPRRVTGQGVAAAAREGDAVACAAMEDLARWLGVGLALIADVFDPELVVIGGGLVDAADLVLPRAQAQVHERVLAGSRRPLVPVVPAVLGERAGAIGVALLAGDLVAP